MKNILIAALAVFVGACSGGKKANNLPFDKISISHQSGEMPPEYQRSYIIIATDENIHVEIRGHENIILDTTINNSYEQFEQYTKAYDYIDLGVAAFDENCTGCPTRHINLTKADTTVYEAKWNNLDNHPALQRLVDVVINSIPNFGELLARKEK